MSKERLFQLRQEAVALIRKGGRSVSEPVCATGSSTPANGHTFLKSHAGA